MIAPIRRKCNVCSIGFELRRDVLGSLHRRVHDTWKNIFDARFDELLPTISAAIACKHVSFEFQELDLDWSTIERFWEKVKAKTYTEVR